MKSWFLLVGTFLGILWLMEPIWASKPLLGPFTSPTEAFILIDCNIANCPYEVEPKKRQKSKVITATIFGYNSLPEQTDSNPFITADGSFVHDGIIANNCLPFNSRVSISGKEYIVKDRMNQRYGCDVFDIWFENLESALQWGKRNELITIYE